MECYDGTNSGKVSGDKGDIVDGSVVVDTVLEAVLVGIVVLDTRDNVL